MKTVMLKSSPNTGTLTLASPLMKETGPQPSGTIIYKITEVPDDISTEQLLMLADATAFLTGFTFPYSALGIGKICRSQQTEGQK